ncbi:MAG: hypothetical protein Kow0060_07050 [Methylohalobius crimeensis]
MTRTAPLYLALLLLCSPAWAEDKSAAKLYRWVDDRGKVHYSDTVPVEAAKHERQIYDKSRLRKLDVVEKAKTPEELARESRLAELRKTEKRLLEEEMARDRALLRTYRNEEELHLALQGQLNTIDARITVLKANIARQRTLLDAKISQAAEIERQGRSVPAFLIESIEGIRRQIRQHHLKIAHESEAKEELKRKFSRDVDRFRKLQARLQQGVKNTATTRPDSEPSGKRRVILSLLSCEGHAECDRAWQLAKIYLRVHATTPLYIDSETILHTEDPHQDQDIALTVARIKGKTGYDTLFLDVRCKLSRQGQALCRSEKVQEIRAGFSRFIQEGLGSAAQ